MIALRLALMPWDQAREEARAVRHQVFCVELGVPPELESDQHDATSQHCLALDAAGVCVGVGRLLADGHIGRVAVLEAARHQGVGAAILEALIECARERALPRVVLNARRDALAFYARHGFVAQGTPYLEAGILHQTMRRDL